MKFPLSWLREFVTWSITDDELAQKLTMAGVEVDAIENFGNSDENIVIAKIENISPHPNADKLSLCEVSIGEGNHLKIVCGANNVRIGLRSPLAKINAQILGQTIKKTNLRGIESEGMLCSAKELELVGLEDIIQEFWNYLMTHRLVNIFTSIYLRLIKFLILLLLQIVGIV